MATVIRGILAAVAILLGVSASAHAALRSIPPMSGPVVDQAGLLSPADQAKLEALARAARAEEAGEGVQLQFLIVPSLEGEPIEDFSIRVAEAWKVGSRGKDNGILIVVARDDRQVRIEVGGGLEGDLTDAQAGRIIRQTIAPAFRAGRYGDGLYEAAVQVLGAVGALPPSVAEPPQAVSRQPGGSGVALMVVYLVIIVVFVVVSRRMGGRAFFLPFLFGSGGNPPRRGWRSGSGGGAGWGGGGWGGGGGGFSGGGASGSW